MLPTKETDPIPSTRDLPLELRRASSAHHGDESTTTAMVSGIVAGMPDEDLICPAYMLRQNLIMPAYPFRAPTPSCTAQERL